MNENFCVIIVGYNRKQNLLSIYNQVNEQFSCDIHIVLDFYSNEFDSWAIKNLNSEKTKIHTSHERLGLKQNVLKALSIGATYNQCIVLEDDLYLSNYTACSFSDILNSKFLPNSVAQISLYLPRINEFSGDGIDFYFGTKKMIFARVPSSQGFIINSHTIKLFLNYISKKEVINYHNLPAQCMKWGSQSWKLKFYDFMVKNDLYTAYPFYSFSTSAAFSSGTNRSVQKEYAYAVPVAPCEIKFSLSEVSENLFNYDQFFNPSGEFLNTTLGRGEQQVIWHTGTKNTIQSLYFATCKSKNVIGRSFSTSLRPPEANLVRGPAGPEDCSEIVLGLTRRPINKRILIANIDLGNPKIVVNLFINISKKIVLRLLKSFTPFK